MSHRPIHLADSLATFEGNSFRMALPAALSLQADYGVTEHFYVNALLMQRLPNFNKAPRRGNLLAVTPRWQHRWRTQRNGREPRTDARIYARERHRQHEQRELFDCRNHAENSSKFQF